MSNNNLESEEATKNPLFAEAFSPHSNYNKNFRSHQSSSIHEPSSTHKTEVKAHVPSVEEVQRYMNTVHDHKDISVERVGIALIDKIGLNEGDIGKILKSELAIVKSAFKHIEDAKTPGAKIARTTEVVGVFGVSTLANLNNPDN